MKLNGSHFTYEDIKYFYSPKTVQNLELKKVLMILCYTYSFINRDIDQTILNKDTTNYTVIF